MTTSRQAWVMAQNKPADAGKKHVWSTGDQKISELGGVSFGKGNLDRGRSCKAAPFVSKKKGLKIYYFTVMLIVFVTAAS